MRLNKKGVSLPELLAVIVIMGLIALIAIPAFTSTIENTRKNAVVSDVITLVDRVQTEVTANNIDSKDDIDWGSIKDDYNGNLPFGVTDEFEVHFIDGTLNFDLSKISAFDWDATGCDVYGKTSDGFAINKTNMSVITKECVV